MPSIKQLQNRLLIKQNSLIKIKADIANAEKIKKNPLLRRLNQEKGLLDIDIRKLDSQLTLEIKAAKPVYI